MNHFFKISVLLSILLFSVYSYVNRDTWSVVSLGSLVKRKAKLWQIHFTHDHKPMIYTVQSHHPMVRIFHGVGPFHHPIHLDEHGVKFVSDVALADPLEGAGQVLYMGDRRQGRIFYMVLGKRHVREMPLQPDLPSAYGDFIAALHPVAESERFHDRY